MYDHSRQYRCTIIRGKAQHEVDNLLPAYAKVIDEICPCEFSDFEESFNNAFSKYLPESNRIKKTLDNHRTEIAGKLFGMYFLAEDGVVYSSDRTKKFLDDNDQPAFFKDVCFKMQFPNGMQKTSTVLDRINNHISIRPNSFVLALLKLAKENGLVLDKKDIGYYVLNSLDVLQGLSSPEEVLNAIKVDRKHGITRDIVVPGKAYSYTHQHINEQMNYLELSNLILISSDGRVSLNVYEEEAIDAFIKYCGVAPEFDVYAYDFLNDISKQQFQLDWDEYYGHLSPIVDLFDTTPISLSIPASALSHPHTSTVDIGDEGEAIVFDYEKNRVAAFDLHLVNRVLSLGRQRGLGFDIQSVVAVPGDYSEFAKYIEVKTTKRVTAPDIDDSLWVDTLNITRNEWLAAKQHKGFYSIYRVYMARNCVTIFVIDNVNDKINNGIINAVPLQYRLDFNNSAINDVIYPDV